MRIDDQLTDAAVLAEIGRRLSRWRLERNLTQAELASSAGLARRTVQRLEDGKPVQLPSFIRVLRAMGMGDSLDRLLPEPVPSPVERLRNSGRRRQRAGGGRKTETAPQDPWVWGDERDDQRNGERNTDR